MPNLPLLHQTLSEIRQDREIAVSVYRDSHKEIEGISLSQESIDKDVQIFEDRLTIGIEYPQIIELLEYHENLYGDPLTRFKDFIDSQNRYGPSLSLQFHNNVTPGKTFNEWLHLWINGGRTEHTKDQRIAFAEILKSLEWENGRIFPSGKPSPRIHLYEMKLRLAKCYCSIVTTPLYAKSKGTYAGYIRKIDEAITKPFERISKVSQELTKDYCTLHKRSNKAISIPLAAQFLRSLEARALESTSSALFMTLLLSWASILIPLPAKQLILLPAPDEENSCLQLDYLRIPLARSFIRFWRSL